MTPVKMKGSAQSTPERPRKSSNGDRITPGEFNKLWKILLDMGWERGLNNGQPTFTPPKMTNLPSFSDGETLVKYLNKKGGWVFVGRIASKIESNKNKAKESSESDSSSSSSESSESVKKTKEARKKKTPKTLKKSRKLSAITVDTEDNEGSAGEAEKKKSKASASPNTVVSLEQTAIETLTSRKPDKNVFIKEALEIKVLLDSLESFSKKMKNQNSTLAIYGNVENPVTFVEHCRQVSLRIEKAYETMLLNFSKTLEESAIKKERAELETKKRKLQDMLNAI